MITTASFVISSPDVASCPQSPLPEYAFIGRSNVGKSSLINMLTHNSRLAKTSQKPGKTLLINHFIINANTPQAWHLVDLPGYGYAQAGQKQREKLQTMIQRYSLLRQPLVSMFVLIDARLEPQPIDLQFMEWLGENEVPFAIVFTKADKLSKSRLSLNVEAYQQKMLETWVELPPIFITSATKGTGETEMMTYIEGLNKQIQQA